MPINPPLPLAGKLLPLELCFSVFDNIAKRLGYSAQWASQVKLVVKNLPANAADVGSIPGSGRSPGGGHGNLLQCSCLENAINREAWWATVHGATKSQIN